MQPQIRSFFKKHTEWVDEFPFPPEGPVVKF